MKSATLSEGYARLLDGAGIPYRLGNPDEMLASVIAHKTEIIDSAARPNSFIKLMDALISEAVSNPEANILLKREPKLQGLIEAIRKEVSRIKRDVSSLMAKTANDAPEIFAVLGKVHAVKSRI